jgi:cytochrome c peroxidase
MILARYFVSLLFGTPKKSQTMGKFHFTSLSLLAGSAFLFNSCTKEKELKHITRDSDMVPNLPAKVEDFPVSGNDQLATLGKVLFYDKQLSLNKNISCGSCHKQENAFTDNLQFSRGTEDKPGNRNTPSIFAKEGRLFWDGRAFSMNDLALRPVRNPVEMNIANMNSLIGRLASLDYYDHLFKVAYPGQDRIDSNMVKNAIAEFLKNFKFSDSKFSHSEVGTEQLNSSEMIGRNLFFGEARCAQCHHIQANQFASNNSGYGVTNENHNIGLDMDNHDKGVGKVTNNGADDGTFMMPVLLNVELTSPYMHDGRFKTLEEVVEHYNSEIKANPNLDERLKQYGEPMRLNLTAQEKKGLVDFLKTLTDRKILTDSRFSDPFVSRAN